MLSVVLALSGSAAGRTYVAVPSLAADLLTLFPISTPRVQRQLLYVLRRVLPQIDIDSIVLPGGYNSHNAIEWLLLCLASCFSLRIRQPGSENAKAAEEDRVATMVHGWGGAHVEEAEVINYYLIWTVIAIYGHIGLMWRSACGRVIKQTLLPYKEPNDIDNHLSSLLALVLLISLYPYTIPGEWMPRATTTATST